MMMERLTRNRSRYQAQLLIAFAAVYLIWGSTYLAIRFAIETLPGYSMSGARFLLAGGGLYIYSRLRGAPRPTRRNWANAALVGALLFLGGNGSVVWAEQRVPSGLAALLIATEPLWIVLLFSFWRGGHKPSLRTALGIGLGFVGAAILSAPTSALGGEAPHLISMIVLVLAALSWATGSLYARGADLVENPTQNAAMQMFTGSIFLLLAGTVAGEWAGFDLAAVSAKSAAAFFYLAIFGSLIGFSAYSWLLRNAHPAKVATYAYVNPIIAVFLGWLLAGEPLGPRTMIAAALILGSVILVSKAKESADVTTATAGCEAACLEASGPLAEAAAEAAEAIRTADRLADDERRVPA
ncbi:MAG: EamA family transporter [Gemmatimonadota bacterium]